MRPLTARPNLGKGYVLIVLLGSNKAGQVVWVVWMAHYSLTRCSAELRSISPGSLQKFRESSLLVSRPSAKFNSGLRDTARQMARTARGPDLA